MWFRTLRKPESDLQDRRVEGIYLGVIDRSDETIFDVEGRRFKGV